MCTYEAQSNLTPSLVLTHSKTRLFTKLFGLPGHSQNLPLFVLKLMREILGLMSTFMHVLPSDLEQALYLFHLHFATCLMAAFN